MNRTTPRQVLEHPVFQALNPKGKQFLRARVIPPSLNPFGISITALLAFGELPHIKTVAVAHMMFEDFRRMFDREEPKHTIVLSSNGNTAHAVERLAPIFGFRSVKIAVDGAEEEAHAPGHYYLNPYGHLGNVRAHLNYTGPEVARALGGRDVGVVAIAMGSGGTVAGVGKYLKQKNRETVVLGVRPLPGERVPGTHDEKEMKRLVTLPWETVVDHVIEVGREEAFAACRSLWGAVEPRPGPSSGLAFAGLVRFLKSLDLVDRKRLGSAAVICPDGTRSYPDDIRAELSKSQL